MTSRTLVSLFVLAIAAALGVVLWWLPRAADKARPVPTAAWVGIEANGSGVAFVGPVRIEAGTSFRLHAIVEARDPEGETVLYTDASEVRFPDGRVFGGDAVGPWDQPATPRAVWFSVEGNVPFLPLAQGARLERFELQEFSRPEWGRGWTVTGSLASHGADQIEGFGAERDFGTQRYQVWMEISEDERAIVPDLRLKSPGPDEALTRTSDFPTVVAALGGAAAKPSSVFGLTQIEPPEGADGALLDRLVELERAGLAFSRLGLLRDTLAEKELRYEELTWRLLDLNAGTPFSEVAAGDLLRVGARWVFLHEDAGVPGVVDPEDLCFDYDAGAVVRPLSEVFKGVEGGGDVEWAEL